MDLDKIMDKEMDKLSKRVFKILEKQCIKEVCKENNITIEDIKDKERYQFKVCNMIRSILVFNDNSDYFMLRYEIDKLVKEKYSYLTE